MGKNTVKKRIFITNALAILAALFILMGINMIVMKIYAESIETEWKASMEKIADKDKVVELVKEWTVHRNSFLILFLADGILCAGALSVITLFFTKNLARHLCEPLNALEEGAGRIRNNDLTQEISYTGEAEFENVCHTFNEMQAHILMEQKKNEKYEKARADMIAGISHDLKTPLTAVKGTLKGMLDGIASTREQQKKFLEIAYRRTGEMDVLLNRLFYLSKLETGNMPVSLQIIQINEFIGSYLHEKQKMLIEGKEEIQEDDNQIQVKVLADKTQLQRIFDNLLENSRKYVIKVPLKMKISLKKQEDQVDICFSDNGEGVPEEKLPFLFEEFYRVDESRNCKEGSGLGLYIVKYLIEEMGGHVWAENAGGLAIHMTLPIKEG